MTLEQHITAKVAEHAALWQVAKEAWHCILNHGHVIERDNDGHEWAVDFTSPDCSRNVILHVNTVNSLTVEEITAPAMMSWVMEFLVSEDVVRTFSLDDGMSAVGPMGDMVVQPV